MADQRLLESGDVRLLESGDVRLLETLGSVGAGGNTITLTAPAVSIGVAAGGNTITVSAPVVTVGVSAGAQTITVSAPVVTVAVEGLPVNLDVFLEQFDELLVSLHVMPSSAPSDLPVTMLVEDGGDAFTVTLDVIHEELETLIVGRRQRPTALVAYTEGEAEEPEEPATPGAGWFWLGLP